MPHHPAVPMQDPTLASAIGFYCAAFGRDALPCLAGLDEAASGPAAVILTNAVRTRRPLRYCAIADALGGPQPPQGGSL